MNKIQIVVKEPLKNPEARDIENTLEAKQAIVGGYIQYIPLDEKGEFDLYLNEEGKFAGLSSNLIFPNDVVMGTIYVTKANDEGSDVGLTDEEVKQVIALLDKISIKNELEAAHYDNIVRQFFG